MAYKKRRITKNPNKNEMKGQRAQFRFPPLATYFQDVERLSLDIRVVNKQGHTMQEDHFEYGPNDPINFLAACPGGCGEGETNLKAKIDSIINQRLPGGEGRAICSLPVYGATESCGCEIKCQIKVAYRAGTESVTA